MFMSTEVCENAPRRSADAKSTSSIPVPGMMALPPTAWSRRPGTLEVETLKATRSSDELSTAGSSL